MRFNNLFFLGLLFSESLLDLVLLEFFKELP
jgi:hypothetical protein